MRPWNRREERKEVDADRGRKSKEDLSEESFLLGLDHLGREIQIQRGVKMASHLRLLGDIGWHLVSCSCNDLEEEY